MLPRLLLAVALACVAVSALDDVCNDESTPIVMRTMSELLSDTHLINQ